MSDQRWAPGSVTVTRALGVWNIPAFFKPVGVQSIFAQVKGGTFAGGGATADTKIQGSIDGTNWIDVTGGALTGVLAATNALINNGGSPQGMIRVDAFTQLRILTVDGGVAPSNGDNFTVTLGSEFTQ